MLSMMFLVKFIAFPSREDAILQAKNTKGLISITASGSIGQYYDGKCHETYPNATILENKEVDWCSNIAKDKDDKPWVEYSLKGKSMRISGYAVRSGCCIRGCCCADSGSSIDYCCCDLYSFSLQASNDRKNWDTLHSVVADSHFYYCQFKSYELKSLSKQYAYVRFVQDAEYPSCTYCMAINQIELYGKVEAGDFIGVDGEEMDDESVSIIGKVKRESIQ